jgi:hypothetical protein
MSKVEIAGVPGRRGSMRAFDLPGGWRVGARSGFGVSVPDTAECRSSIAGSA